KGTWAMPRDSRNSHRVARLLVELRRGVHDVGLIDLLRPILRADFLEGHGDRLLSVAQDVHHALGDFLGEPGLLPLGLPRPEFHDAMCHNAYSPIMPPEPRLLGSTAHFASRLI